MADRIIFRLGNCEVCAINVAKYTCPACSVKTCCLDCVNIHKKELQCTGIRNKVKFKPLHKLNSSDLQSDYCLLESTARAVNRVANGSRILNKSTFYSIARMKIKNAAKRRNINLQYLPKCFKKHRENSTYYHWKSDKLFWKVEWIFPEAEMFSIVDEKVPETELMSNILNKHFDLDQCSTNVNLRKRLKPYLEVDEASIHILLKLENYGSNKYLEVDKNDTLMENLSLQSLVEYPVFYVVNEAFLHKYDLVKRDDPGSKKFSNNYQGINLLFDPEELPE